MASPFLTSLLDGGARAGSRFWLFIPGERLPSTRCIRHLVRPKVVLTLRKKEKPLSTARDRTPISRWSSRYPRSYIDWSIQFRAWDLLNTKQYCWHSDLLHFLQLGHSSRGCLSTCMAAFWGRVDGFVLFQSKISFLDVLFGLTSEVRYKPYKLWSMIFCVFFIFKILLYGHLHPALRNEIFGRNGPFWDYELVHPFSGLPALSCVSVYDNFMCSEVLRCLSSAGGLSAAACIFRYLPRRWIIQVDPLYCRF
jgi:hypothetical protein